VDAGSATKASHLKDELAAKGRVALYGIHFDTDSAKIRPDSEPVLQEILALLQGSPDLKLEIQGHTDSTGTRPRNQTLSGERAASVKSYLTGRGIAPARLSTAGFADTVPVGDNATSEGRAKNRRVELVRK
jgi:OOP family OmpA-OmpF porin